MTGLLLLNAKQQFIDINGNPLVDGSVYFYTPNTLILKDTWQDADQQVLNTNPVVLDSRGQALIYGVGAYRQIVKDSAGNTIWDELTYGADGQETGTFTPVFNSDGGGSWTYTIQSGRYIKTGNQVWVSIYLKISATSGGSGSMYIEGLPFTSVNVTNAFYGGGLYPAFAGNINNFSWFLGPNSTSLFLRKYTAGTDAGLSYSDITSNLEIAVTLTYEAEP